MKVVEQKLIHIRPEWSAEMPLDMGKIDELIEEGWIVKEIHPLHSGHKDVKTPGALVLLTKINREEIPGL